MENREYILDKAKQIINGDRVDQYGQPEDCFQYIANYWSVYLNEKFGGGEVNIELKPEDVAQMMALLKIARLSGSGQIYKEDNYIDAIGYLAIANSLCIEEKVSTDDNTTTWKNVEKQLKEDSDYPYINLQRHHKINLD